MATLRFGDLGPAQVRQAQDLVGQRLDPLGAGRHGAGGVLGGGLAVVRAALCSRLASWRPAKTVGLVAPSISGSAISMVVSTGPRPPPVAAHWPRVWNSSGWAAT